MTAGRHALAATAAALLFILASAAQESFPAAQFRAAVEPDAVVPGGPIAFIVSGPRADEAVRAVIIGRGGKTASAAQLFSLGQARDGTPLRAALLAVPTRLPPGVVTVQALSADSSVLADAAVAILPRDFRKENIPLNQANSTLRTVPDPKKTTESEELWRILSRFDPSALHALGPFLLPVETGNRTSGFGDRRVYRYTDGTEESSIHAGIDFGVPTGTPVRSVASGRVVLARDRMVTGKSVVLEHLPGVYSAYYHLSRIAVAQGAAVEAGVILGLSGSTGMSTGPHLHWEIRVSGEAADPDLFMARRVLDKDFILSRIEGSSAPN